MLCTNATDAFTSPAIMCTASADALNQNALKRQINQTLQPWMFALNQISVPNRLCICDKCVCSLHIAIRFIFLHRVLSWAVSSVDVVIVIL